jgi:TPR repeat protein
VAFSQACRRPKGLETPVETGTKLMLTGMEAANQSLPVPRPDATGDELFRLGLLYSTGQGGAPLDYVSAHMLFNLAAMRGSVEAKVYRKELAEEMASEDIAEAQRQAREWLARG